MRLSFSFNIMGKNENLFSKLKLKVAIGNNHIPGDHESSLNYFYTSFPLQDVPVPLVS